MPTTLPQQSPRERLRRIYAENTKPIVPFIGAGLSIPAKLPDWSTLRRFLEDALREKIADLDLDKPTRERRLSTLATIRSSADPWLAFELLRREIGAATYSALIRDVFKDVDRTPVPSLYTSLWSLSIPGVVTTNLDRFAGRAFAEKRPPGTQFHELSGQAAGRNLSARKTRIPFIVNLHGRYDESDT